MMDLYNSLAVFIFIVSAQGQLHPDDLGVTCYVCKDHDWHNFPRCLQRPIRCDQGEVCQIQHGFGTDAHVPEIYCRSPWECKRDLNSHHIPCKGGGFRIDDDICEECCDTNECVANMTNYLRLELVSSQNLFCPGQCMLDDIEDCVHNGRVCERLEFCRVRIDHTNRITGECIEDYLYASCQRYKSMYPCPVDFKDPSTYNSTNSYLCTHDCCTTNECLFPHYGIHMAHVAVSTSQAPNAGGSSGDNDGLWQRLHGSCQDTFNLELCQSLKNDHDLCRSRLSLSMCPETCGICAAVGSSVCEDTNSLCPAMQSSDLGFCDTEEAMFQCPTTCGKCDQLLDSVIMSVLNGTITAPPPLTTGTPAPGSPTAAPMDCGSIKADDCIHLGPLCKTTFLGVVCPEQCDFCMDGEGISAL